MTEEEKLKETLDKFRKTGLQDKITQDIMTFGRVMPDTQEKYDKYLKTIKEKSIIN